MHSSATLLLYLLNSLTIALAVLLGLLFLKHRKELAIHRFTGPFKFVYLGIFLSSLSFLTDGLEHMGLLSLPGPVVQERTILWLHAGYVAGSIITLLGLAVFINRVIPLSSRQVLKLAAAREQLAASNDEMAKTIAQHNQRLEANNSALHTLLADQKQSRRALLASEHKFRTLFDESPAIFMSVDQHQHITEINRHGANALGYHPEELLKLPFAGIVAPGDRPSQDTFFQACLGGTLPPEIELRLIKKNAQHLWVKISARRISANDGTPLLIIVCQDISESKQLAESLSYQAQHDDLTGLYNRRALEAFLGEQLQNLSAITKPTALIYIDIDQLKVVNDTCGHSAGDEFIRLLVQRINEHQQNFDFFARVGGDELALVMCDTSREEAVDMAELARNIAEDLTFVWEEQSFRQSISVGVALTSRNIRTLTEILGAADAACYTAKQLGRNRVLVQEDTPEKLDTNRSEMLWVSRLQTALIRDHFELFFQPIMALRNGQHPYIHYEVLIRYLDDDGSHRTPDNFLPAAERFGLASQIDLWVLTTMFDFLDKHPAHSQALDCCSLNLSSHSLASHQTRSAIKQLLMTANFPVNKLCFEITETNAIHNLEEASQFVAELKILGCRFALDDFGTGFSSFGYLQNLDVDYIKIDGSFIKDIVTNKVGRSMVKAMNAIGRELGIATIAEYVESGEIMAELTQLGVPYGQGFGLAKPMPLSFVEEFYSRSAPSVINQR